MPPQRHLAEHARRIFGTYQVAVEELASTRSDLAPEMDSLSADGNLESTLESLATASPSASFESFEVLPLGGGPPAEAAIALHDAIARERTAVVAEGLQAMKKVEAGRDDLSPQEQAGLEAIILLTGRPALLIQNGEFLEPPKKWAVLKEMRPQIRSVIERVGRIEVAGDPNFDWLGTGFLVGADVVMTNRHVAIEFSRSSGSAWKFRPNMSASIDFRQELGGDEPFLFAVEEIIGIHDDHDLALLRVSQISSGDPLPDPLPVAAAAPSTLKGRQVYVIGYPAWDGRRNDPEPMLRIFSNIFNVKRLQPGEISGDALGSFEIFHDCSTLGGNSGSPVVDLETHRVVGLHFGGRFLQKNHAVPLWALRDDPLVQQAGLNFQS